MSKEELAVKLNGRQIGREITDREEKQAKGSALLIVFGASDDLIELRGAISDEVGAYGGGECFIINGKLLPPLDDESVIEILRKHGVLEIAQKSYEDALLIEGKWDCNKYSWFMATPADYAPFDIMDGDEKYCRGIVVQL